MLAIVLIYLSCFEYKSQGGQRFERNCSTEGAFLYRYGENPHQGAAFYTEKTLASAKSGGVGTASQHHGKEMSYNNYLVKLCTFLVCNLFWLARHPHKFHGLVAKSILLAMKCV